jgi:hypothetical protein
MGHKVPTCSDSALQEFHRPQILDPELSSLENTLNLKFDSDKSHAEGYRLSASSRPQMYPASVGSPKSHQKHTEHNLISSFRDGDYISINHPCQAKETSISHIRRGTRGRRISQRRGPNDLNLVLELLPCIIGFIYIATVYFGIL